MPPPCQGRGALVIYGRGANLGDFGVFAHDLATHDLAKYGHSVAVMHIERKVEFLLALQEARSFEIAELHIISHSFGAGLALAYHDPEIDDLRDRAIAANWAEGRGVDFDELLSIEIGVLLSDDLAAIPPEIRDRCRVRFTRDAFVKVWGCRAGVSNWHYHDERGTLRYWAVLMQKDTPKPSIARALGDFLGVKAFAAHSPAHIEVLDGDLWLTTDKYKDLHGRWPSPTLRHRLHPDAGGYERCVL